jgi:hypothetical protein
MVFISNQNATATFHLHAIKVEREKEEDNVTKILTKLCRKILFGPESFERNCYDEHDKSLHSLPYV